MPRRTAMLIAVGFAVCLSAVLRAQMKDPPLPLPGGATERVDPATAVEFLSSGQVTVPAHRATEIDLHFRVANGLHINSHAPLDKSLIPARLAVVEAHGLNVTAVDFPPGAEYAPQFAPKEKLSVYTGEFILRAHVTAEPGDHALEAGLRYQACDANSCMPPHTIPVEITVTGK
jgi:hypothetical protein